MNPLWHQIKAERDERLVHHDTLTAAKEAAERALNQAASDWTRSKRDLDRLALAMDNIANLEE